jgi:hypothetical protein
MDAAMHFSDVAGQCPWSCLSEGPGAPDLPLPGQPEWPANGGLAVLAKVHDADWPGHEAASREPTGTFGPGRGSAHRGEARPGAVAPAPSWPRAGSRAP